MVLLWYLQLRKIYSESIITLLPILPFKIVPTLFHLILPQLIFVHESVNFRLLVMTLRAELLHSRQALSRFITIREHRYIWLIFSFRSFFPLKVKLITIFHDRNVLEDDQIFDSLLIVTFLVEIIILFGMWLFFGFVFGEVKDSIEEYWNQEMITSCVLVVVSLLDQSGKNSWFEHSHLVCAVFGTYKFIDPS